MPDKQNRTTSTESFSDWLKTRDGIFHALPLIIAFASIFYAWTIWFDRQDSESLLLEDSYNQAKRSSYYTDSEKKFDELIKAIETLKKITEDSAKADLSVDSTFWRQLSSAATMLRNSTNRRDSVSFEKWKNETERLIQAVREKEKIRLAANLSKFHVIVVGVALVFLFWFWNKIKKFDLNRQLTAEEVVLDQTVAQDSLYPGGGRNWEFAKIYANDAVKQFNRAWLVIWFGWLGLYGSMLYFHNNYFKSSSWLEFPLDLSNSVSSVAFFAGYWMLSRKTVGEPGEKVSLFRAVVIFSLATMIVVLPAHLPVEKFRHFALEYSSQLKLVNGLVAGIIMALFTGRLGSLFLKMPEWIHWFLYAYAAIQALYFSYGGDQLMWTALVMTFALLFKCVLFLFISWLLQSGRLLFYTVRVRVLLYDQLEEQWIRFCRNI
ncbi:MAG: hypothetical protein ILNGONEN_00195 [Syntrophorhabdaceae bacterium]|nr:hypothetical protein [Syntrophorhabdaceae bacterium]